MGITHSKVSIAGAPTDPDKVGGPDWNAAHVNTFVGCRVYKAAAQSIAENTNNVVTTYDTEDYDTDTIHSAGVFTVPANMGGKWRLNAKGGFAGNATGIRYGVWYKNGTTEIGFRHRVAGTSTGSTLDYTWVFQDVTVILSAGDTVSFTVFQNRGGGTALNYGDGTPYCAWAEVMFMGA